jgi:hypothetical protein
MEQLLLFTLPELSVRKPSVDIADQPQGRTEHVASTIN